MWSALFFFLHYSDRDFILLLTDLGEQHFLKLIFFSTTFLLLQFLQAQIWFILSYLFWLIACVWWNMVLVTWFVSVTECSFNVNRPSLDSESIEVHFSSIVEICSNFVSISSEVNSPSLYLSLSSLSLSLSLSHSLPLSLSLSLSLFLLSLSLSLSLSFLSLSLSHTHTHSQSRLLNWIKNFLVILTKSFLFPAR